ncbi:MAG: putative transposase [Acidobacteriota bacterium]
MLTVRLPLLPPDARVISPDLAVLLDETRLVVFNGSGQIYTCSRDDREGMRLAAAMFSDLQLAKPTALARALKMNPVTVFRSRRLFRAGGVAGVRSKKRGPKGPSKLTDKVRARAQRQLDQGWSIRRTADEVGVVEGTLRYALKRGQLRRPTQVRPSPVSSPGVEALSRPAERAEQDHSSGRGVAVKRVEERGLARLGQLEQATPSFERAEAMPGAGVLLALPALLNEGLIEVGKRVYGKLNNGFFGLRSVLLIFAFMALLRIKNPEQLTEHAPGELGLLLGLDRAPEVKTLRRKLHEMGLRQRARAFTQQLTERWARAAPRELALLYVDGHVRPYNGRKHVLPKQHVQQRGRPMPGTKDFHGNDRRADPLLFVTAEATEGLLTMLDSTLLPEVRRLVGPRRRVTIAFDREGWSPKLFAKWKGEDFDVLTYRKGKQSRWQKRFFTTVRGTVGGQKVEYSLAEREVKLSNGLKVREIRRLTSDGHQTAVITTKDKLRPLAVAHRMFSRWRQENFFRYMRHEFALDHLCTQKVEPADPKRIVSHPERARLEKKLRTVRVARETLLDRWCNLLPGKKIRIGKRRLDEAEIERLIQKREIEADKLAARIEKLPKRVCLDEVLEPDQIVQLERERKILVDATKLTAYRAESSLARLVEPFFSRHEEEARKLLKSIFRATADLIPDRRNRRLTVRFHGLASPRATRALSALCALVNADAPLYPDSNLRLHFEAPVLQK